MSYGGGYLSAPNIGLIGSAPASALPLAATLLHWGRSGLSDHLNADMNKAEQLASIIEEHPDFEIWGPCRTGIVVWKPKNFPAAEVRSRLKKAWVSLTQIDNETWLRSVAANPGADPDFVFQQVLEAANIR